jgi:hypothetical protein
MPENGLSEKREGWVKAIRSLVQIRIKIFKRSISTKATSVLNDSDLKETMSIIQEKNMLFFLQIRPVTTLFCKKHYIELG